ncbi:MAG: cysteate synthase [Methanothrix sp.]|nr:cysteate synthase [Methanothrix sp.]
MGEFLLRCVKEGSVQPEYSMSCPNDQSLLRAEYISRQIKPGNLPGIWRFMDWLPVHAALSGVDAGPVTYRSRALAEELGLDNLFISFNGFWPERGAHLPTCSFKDLEAAPTIERLKERGEGSTLVLASAGNTARAFVHVAALTGWPLLLFLPEKALYRMWTVLPDEAEAGSITIIAVRGDYYDAISMAEQACSLPGFVSEGGARNIARRDGMGTVMLDAALHMGETPQHYFQAVGSGTGGISAWEAALRLRGDGRFGSVLPRLHLAQNIPNAPIYYQWKGLEPEAANSTMFDDVLFNRKPPYAIPGGVRDALLDTGGEVYGISDRQAEEAKRLMEESEEIDVLNAAAVAVAALCRAAGDGTVSPKDTILLNITGGGLARMKESYSSQMLKPQIIVSSWEEAAEFLEGKR